MDWDNLETLEGVVDFCDVFVDSIPELIVYHPELFNKGHLKLYIDAGKGKRSLEIPDAGNRVKFPYDSPVKGSVFVEPLGRQRAFKKYRNKKLKFCYIPSCKIKWPNYLLSYNEKTSVKIDAANELSFTFSGDCKFIGNTGRNEWEFPPDHNVIEGYINTDSFQVPIAKCLYRAGLLNEKMSLVESIGIEDFIDGNRFFLTGYPGTRAKIYIEVNNTNKILADLGSFDKAGKKHFRSEAIKDALRNFNYPTGRIGVSFNDRIILTGTIIYNVNEMKRCLSQEDQISYGWVDDFPSKTRQALIMVKNAIEGNLISVSLDECKHLPVGIETWGEEILFCASVFGKVRLENCKPSFINKWKNLKSTIRLLEQSDQLKNSFTEVQNIQNDALKEIDKISWRPPIEKWKIKFERLLANFKADSNIFDLLLEWKYEVLKSPSVMVQYESKIAQINHGKKLTNAWKKYRRGRVKNSFDQCRRIYNESDPPVSDLAKILENLLLYKSDRSELIKENNKSCHYQLVPIVEKSISLRNRKNDNFNTNSYSKYLPLLDEDNELL